MDIMNELKEMPLFAALNDDELLIVSKICNVKTVKKDEMVFKEGEKGEELFIVRNGCVKVFTRVTDNVEKTLITLRSGGLFGEMAVVTEDYRSAYAQATEECELIYIKKTDFDKLLETEIAVSKKVLDIFLKILSDRLKRTTSLYTQAVDWGLSISGILNLNYSFLINHREKLLIKLLNGEEVSGVILKVETNSFGSEFLMQKEDKTLLIIPYASIASISFSKPQVVIEEEV